MGRRIVREAVNSKSGFDFLLIPLIRLFTDERPINQPETDGESKNHSLPGEGINGEISPSKPDSYVDQVLKYIPSEIVAAFLFMDGILRSSGKATVLYFWLIFIFLLAITPFYIWAVTSEKVESTGAARKPAWDQIIISFFSFAVWVFAIGGPFKFLSWYDPAYGSTSLVLFTFLPPIISKIISRASSIIIYWPKNSMK